MLLLLTPSPPYNFELPTDESTHVQRINVFRNSGIWGSKKKSPVWSTRTHTFLSAFYLLVQIRRWKTVTKRLEHLPRRFSVTVSDAPFNTSRSIPMIPWSFSKRFYLPYTFTTNVTSLAAELLFSCWWMFAIDRMFSTINDSVWGAFLTFECLISLPVLPRCYRPVGWLGDVVKNVDVSSFKNLTE